MDEGNDPLVPPNELAAEISQTEKNLAQWRWSGRGPRYVKIGRAVFYRRSAIQMWLSAQEREPGAKRRAA